MIALVKLFKKIGDSKGAQPFALVENNELVTSLSEEQRLELFPNEGRVFIHPNYEFQQHEVFRIYELAPFQTFDETRPGSMKYKLGSEITDFKLYEVIDLDYSLEENPTEIAKLLRNGMRLKQPINTPILFRTLDDLLIGPITLKLEDGLYYGRTTKSKFYSYFINEAEIISINDAFRDQERMFTISRLVNSNLLGWLDVAKDEEVFESTFEQLQKYEKYGNEMHQMLNEFNGIINEEKLLDEQLEIRLNRAIALISQETKFAPLLDKISNDVGIFRSEHESGIAELATEQPQRNYNYSKALQQSPETSVNNLSELQNLYIKNLHVDEELAKQLAMIMYTAALINEPVILYGHQSFDLSQIVAKTMACEETISYVPEIEAFSLENLQQQFNHYNSEEKVKALLLHEVTSTTAQYSVPIFIKQLKWIESEMSPDLFILTVSNKDEAFLLQQKMPSSIVINADKYVKDLMTKQKIQSLTKGQLQLNEFEYPHNEIDSNYLKRSFSKELEFVVPQEVVYWLFYFNELNNLSYAMNKSIKHFYEQHFQTVKTYE